ncbi:MAG: response regulator [Planctomycetaceae bacterium]|nr:response regulator [Planctomycetaceae bacterium]
MSSSTSTPTNSVLDEIRSTIASFESLRTAGTARAAESGQSSLASNPLVAVAAPVPMSFPAKKTEGQAQELRDNAAPSANGSKATFPDSVKSKTTPPRDPSTPGRKPILDAIFPIQESVLVNPPVTSDTARQPETRNVHSRINGVRGIDKSAKIMIVDDEPLNVMTFRQHLKMEGYENFVTTSDAREALHLLRSERPDVLLLDIRMPEISGMDILRVIGLDPVLQHTPVLILTAASDPATRKQALDLGASDFLQKPIEPNELLPRVRNAIVIKKHYDMASSEATRLEQQVERRTRQLEATRQQLILCLARAAEHRDNDTGNHVIRVGRYTAIIARQMGYPENRLEMLEQAAQLHDVGKIGIPDSILFKPGKLGIDEYDLMKKHCALGRQIIEPISEKEWNILKTHTRIGESMLHVRSSSLLMLAARIAQTHHERWDGKGYPLGLLNEDIPLEGRIVAVADVFDALSSKRPYKDPFPREKCFEILREGRGTQFDPAVIDAFFDCAEEIVEIQLLLMDEEDRIPKGEWETLAQAAVANA